MKACDICGVVEAKISRSVLSTKKTEEDKFFLELLKGKNDFSMRLCEECTASIDTGEKYITKAYRNTILWMVVYQHPPTHTMFSVNIVNKHPWIWIWVDLPEYTAIKEVKRQHGISITYGKYTGELKDWTLDSHSIFHYNTFCDAMKGLPSISNISNTLIVHYDKNFTRQEVDNA